MQCTVKESFYWPGIDAAKDMFIHACATSQQRKITAVKKIRKNPSADSP
jgi:hypothetical protein